MKTNVLVYWSSEGGKPNEIVAKFKEQGFEPGLGKNDFVLNWETAPALEDVLKKLDALTEALKGLNVRFKAETVE